MSPGHTYEVRLVDGDIFIGKYVTYEKGFHVFEVGTEIIPIKQSSLSRIPTEVFDER